MKYLFIFSLFIFLISGKSFAVIHKQTENFIDIELSKDQFMIDCSDYPEDDTSYIGFNLIDGDTYYLFFYRRPLTLKMCHAQKEEYLRIIYESETVRIVGITSIERVLKDSEREKYPAPFNQAKKIISVVFIRLQSETKCKSYFVDDCVLPKNYWAGVLPQ